MRRSASYITFLLFLLIGFAPASYSQVPTGTVRGQIKDQADAVVSGARVTVISKDTGAERTFTTKSDGEYQITNLQPGEYEIKVVAAGFKTSLSPVIIQVGENVTVEFKLEVGAANETVVITSETAAINTTDFKVDGVVNRKQIDNLPLNGRNFLQLAMLEPGVTVEAVDNPGTSPNNFFRVSIAGASQALTRISVDGATVNDRVTGGTSQNFSQETVQEFQISSFNFDLATSVTGVGSVNVVSRSGSNDFHGSAFIYYRDHNMAGFPALQRNPRRFIDPSLDEPFFARRQMGGSIGGPIKKDKAFFFFNYERNNQDGVVPIANRHPIFSQFDVAYPQPLDFHSTNTKFDYKINDKHNTFLRFSTDNNKNFNSANGVFMPSNWVATKNVSAQGLIGLSSVFTPKLVNDLRVSYGVYSGRLNIPTNEVCPDPVYCLGINSPRISTTLSNFIIGNNLNTPQNRVLRTYQLIDTVSWRKGEHGIRFGGEWEHHYGQGHWAFLEPAFVTLWDPLHILAFIAGTGGANSPFVPLYNALPDSLKLNATGTGPLRPGLLPTYQDILRLPLAGFAAGVGDPGQPQPFNFNEAARNNRFKLFFADQWRIKPRFTLTYGVAYTYEDKLLNHDLDRPAILAPLLGGNLEPSPRDKNNFGPSLGFAWDLAGNGKTVLRGGGGIYYDSNLFWTRLNERAYIGPSGNGRYIVPGTIFTSAEFPNGLQFASFPTAYDGTRLARELPTLRAGAAALLGNGTDLSRRGVETLKTTGEIGFGTVFDPDTATPYSMNASVGIQRELMPNMSITADFVMRRTVKIGGLHSVFFIDRNRYNRSRITEVDPVTGRGDSRPNPIIPLCATAAQARDPKAICSNGSIGVSHAGATYRYTGLHVKLDRRFSNRYLFVASYALSKYTGFNGVINFDNFYEANDYQDADRTHKFTFSGFYDVPTYGGDNRFLRGLLNTWKVGLISQFISKPALSTTISGVDLDGDGNNTLILPGTSFRNFGRGLDERGVRQLVENYNKTLPTSVTGKRTVRDQVIPVITLPADFDNGDTFLSQDLRLTRVIRIREKAQLELIGEVFNLFNISNLVGYSGTLNGTDANGQPSFGQPGGRAGGVFGTGGPRAFQVAARLTF